MFSVLLFPYRIAFLSIGFVELSEYVFMNEKKEEKYTKFNEKQSLKRIAVYLVT